MKNILHTLLCSLFITTFTFGQTQSLFDGNNSYGGFGGPMLEFSNINGQLVGDVGGGGALIINDLFIGAYGLGSDAANITLDEKIYDIDFGHGGFWFGYTAKQNKLLHLYTSFRVGWGEVELQEDGDKVVDDTFLALAPELGIELNVTDWFKLGFSGGYKYINGIKEGDLNFEGNAVSLSDNDFSGIFGMITFRFGGFGDYRYDSYSNNNDSNDPDFDF